ncbi:ROK family glucokinase [Rudaeicoccus suwonensis]|uniref:Glucokinase n=1 Tax=Rudaeicoccus suwonensis TaxID=657409 RepID=A0A561EBM3_9MICO|nr:ROK family glucokinase [Rudaeicoccus suwonensis]TWE13011.1 glucokinase [Rudaeicoccus suwonensis]
MATVSIGIDIGGTKIAGGVVDQGGQIVRRARRDTPAQDPDAIAHTTADLILELAAGADHIAGVGVACAGYIDKVGSTVLFAPNLAWRDEPLKARLSSQVELPVLIENDANAAAYGEFLHGGGKAADDMIMMTVGTGVGGGIINDGNLVRGAFGFGGEIGHLRVMPDGLPCGCGKRGCLEAYGSGSALLRAARKLVQSGAPEAAVLSQMCDGDVAALRGSHVTEAAKADDPAAIGLLADLGRWLGEAAASLSAVCDPELFVIGGGVADAGDLLLEPMRAAYRAQQPGLGQLPVAGFAGATLGNDAGVIGAAMLAMEIEA